MKNKLFILATALLLAVIVIVSCKKDQDNTKANNTKNLVRSPELSDMDKDMIAFGEKLKAASDKKSVETMPIMEALNTLSNYQNFSMCDASHCSIEMLTDTIHSSLNVSEGEVLLSELNSFYETTRMEIMSRLNTSGTDQQTLFCIESVAENGTISNPSSITGDMDVDVIVRINDPTMVRYYDPIEDDTLSWYDFEGLGICNCENEGQYLGWDCVSIINARLHNSYGNLLCEQGYQTYYTNINRLQIHAGQYLDASSPNGYSSIPWRSFWDNEQCVSPTDIIYYMNSISDIFDELEQNYMQPVIDFYILENQIDRWQNFNWEALIIVRLGDINCTPITPND